MARVDSLKELTLSFIVRNRALLGASPSSKSHPLRPCLQHNAGELIQLSLESFAIIPITSTLRLQQRTEKGVPLCPLQPLTCGPSFSLETPFTTPYKGSSQAPNAPKAFAFALWFFMPTP